MEYDPKALGARIKARRIDLGISQTRLSEIALLGGYKTQVYRIENGLGRISDTQLSRIADALKTTVGYLVTGGEPALTRNEPEFEKTSTKLLLKARPNSKTLLSVYDQTAEDIRSVAKQTGYSIPEITDVLIQFALVHLEVI